ncbi:C40 family peptidase [Streptomyces odontomachi]|uniref:C40 family peptidase n=1 Tax=Streptomyces odontomachi TaxID=2944940 RepID=UPI00210B803B|nr:NlpC/P60 family protein [Streptomyces sp. ODS25]
MTGRLVRGICTAAAAAVAAGSLVAGTPASAQPGPVPAPSGPAAGSGARAGAPERDSTDRDSTDRGGTARAGAGRGTTDRAGADRGTTTRDTAHRATTGRAAAPGAPGAPGAGETSVTALLNDLRRLYATAEAADTAYRTTQRTLQRRRGSSAGLNRRLTRAQRALHDSKVAAGRLARLQYQGSSTALSPYVQLLLARDPQHALEQGHMLQRVSAARASVVHRLTDDERRARTLAAHAHRRTKAQEARAARQKRQRDAARARLKAVEKQLAALGATPQATARGTARPDTRPEPERSTQATAAAASLTGLTGSARSLLSRALSSSRPPSKAGAAALRYAVQQIGKPYRWGAAGPDAFDCSGLTSQAWAHAGRTLPRTSQAQWRSLPRVSMDQLRPGDLVVYYPTATHVALYVGGGMVVQAPRPGERVKVSPVRSNPVLGAVRPG